MLLGSLLLLLFRGSDQGLKWGGRLGAIGGKVLHHGLL